MPQNPPDSQLPGRRPRVVYVIGVGRSGSTLLDITLGNHPRVESVGEIKHLVRGSWSRDGFCACGERVRSCSFWPAVHAAWHRRTGAADFTEMAEAMDGLLRLRRRRHWSRLVEAGDEGELLRTGLGALYEAILEVSGKDVVVDSSKAPGLGLLAGSLPGVDVAYVHLVRDVRGVARSFRKSFARDERAGIERAMPGRSIWRAAAVWNLTNRLAEQVGRQRPAAPFIRIRYEDLVGDCVNVLDRLGPAIGVDLTEVGESLAAGEPLPVGHNIGGNRIRMQGEVRLRRPTGRRSSGLSLAERLVLGAMCGIMRRRYGYS